MTINPFRITPSLGPDVNQVVPAGTVWYNSPDIATPQLGSTCHASDGREYIWVQASGAIATATAPGTQVAITVTGPDNVTAATGTGGFYAPPTVNYPIALAAGDRFWAAKGTTPLA